MSKIKPMPFVTVEQVLALRNAAIELERERDELAAQVERLKEALGKLSYMAEHEAVENDIVVYQALHRSALKARAVLNETPAQSQAAMKVEWQAEGVLMFAAYALTKHQSDFIDWAKTYADEVRQRAQEAGK